MPIVVTCQHCKIDVRVPPVRVAAFRFCSNRCKYASFNANGWPRLNGWNKRCEVCSAPFRVTPSQKQSRFCSQACMLVWRGPILRDKNYKPHLHVELKCEWCNGRFKRHKCSLLRVGDGRFCSRSCRAKSINSWASKRTSLQEREFCETLRAAGLMFESQVRFSHYTVDVLFRDARLVVEFDGDYWHSLPRVKKLDQLKDQYLASIGFLVHRVWASDFKQSPDAVLNQLMSLLNTIAR